MKILGKIVCFTGHRRVPASEREELTAIVDREIRDAIANGFYTFRAGGALGFDTIAALRVLAVRREPCYRDKDIRLALYLPCQNQTRGWAAEDVKIYEEIAGQADEIRYASVSGHYFNGCMQLRNRMLVDGADLCLAFLQKNQGGSLYTVTYALSHGVEVHNLAQQMQGFQNLRDQ